ncbi:MAG: PEP/pyruvate-binding domain-containing protein [Pseudomonadota bacterium]
MGDKKMFDLILAYRLYQKMMQYPKLIDEMRKIFLDALVERGIVKRESLQAEAAEGLKKSNTAVTEETLREYTDALIDLYFVQHFSEAQIQNYINLARKIERFQNLNRVVNVEGTTSITIKQALKEFCAIPEGDIYIPANEAIETRVALIRHFISDQLPFVSVAKNHITIRDIDEIIDQSYWSRRLPGRIGGKAAGMLLAYRIILPRLAKKDPELEKYVRIPESYYFNSGIFTDFLDYNKLHKFHSQKYKSREMIEEEYKSISGVFEKAVFPPDVVELFQKLLVKVSGHPLILRSSTFLEDNFGYSFSGKYDSVFLANQGDLKARLQAFISGMKWVHMSTYGPAPILYRRVHNLLDYDEKMSVLVQKVTGRRFGDYFFPFAAGVAYSYNSYGWTPRIRKEDGLIRLVFGLGTRAVNRFDGEYPRMVALSHPGLRPEVEAGKIMRYSQKMIDVINLMTGVVEAVPWLALLRAIDHPDLPYAISVNEGGYLVPPRFRGHTVDPTQSCITFDRLLSETPFVRVMRTILKKLEEAYGSPVDVEFSWDDNKLYLLQCRTLRIQKDEGEVILPESLPQDHVLFINNECFANAVIRNIEYIVYIDPKAYARLERYEDKIMVGRAVSKLNKFLEGKRYALFGPARWGSNDINLGVRVAYEDINHTVILGEIAFEEKSSTLEVSHGTHFFNDLVEAQITPIAIYPNQPGVVFREDFFLKAPNMLASTFPDLAAFASVVHLIDIPASIRGLMLQVLQGGQQQQGIGFFSPPEKSFMMKHSINK